MDIPKQININEIEKKTEKKIHFPDFIIKIFDYFVILKEKEYNFNDFVFDSKYLLSLIKLFSKPVSDASLEKSQPEYLRMLVKFLGVLESVRKNLPEKDRISFDDLFSPICENFYENIALLLSDLSAIKDYQLIIKS